MWDVEKLLVLIENRPPIYNFKLKEHSDKCIIDKLWMEIAKEMKTTAECKTKYTTLRNSYARYLRENPPPGVSAAKKRKKTWYLSAAMSFLKDHMMVNRRSRNSIDADTIDNNSCSSSSSIPSTVPEFEEKGRSINCTPYPRCSKGEQLKPADKLIAEPMAEYSTTRLDKSGTEDPNLTFFKSVLPDLKKLSAQRQRKVKQDFLFNLNKLLDDQEMEFSEIKYCID
ncbi:uncharacterized protein LOC129949288 isoform X2 [Eupeodes corollae]|uniref:uncharacterized protein LOC129949288 isoform X2 n=1 Tax=Eupeodes corollae TaxID=290404 RepID=UPI0024931451|nr:uncharacterized protein LOC129949288 isoform X2 [Eupeodes corollae]